MGEAPLFLPCIHLVGGSTASHIYLLFNLPKYSIEREKTLCLGQEVSSMPGICNTVWFFFVWTRRFHLTWVKYFVGNHALWALCKSGIITTAGGLSMEVGSSVPTDNFQLHSFHSFISRHKHILLHILVAVLAQDFLR